MITIISRDTQSLSNPKKMYDKDGCRGQRSMTIKEVIPKSRLASIGGHLVSDPKVCDDGDDVHEVNFTDDDVSGDLGGLIKMESWMLQETEHAFLKYIVGEWVLIDRILGGNWGGGVKDSDSPEIYLIVEQFFNYKKWI